MQATQATSQHEANAPAKADISLTVGRNVLLAEANALQLSAERLDNSFVEAVDLILATKGRVIVSGMGKSGHIGRKIAATLASTGTPAHFVHPAEASHGDLGMVTQQDVAIVLSNSGETPELQNLIEHTRRFEIPLIGVAGRPDSTLLRASDVSIVLADAPEACPMGLAPTTSTTMTLAIGDALAVALMERRDFRPENFRAFHPGGKLGAKLLRVAALMHPRDALPLVLHSAPMSDAILEITNKSFGVAGVTDADGSLIGVISDGDLRRNMKGLLSKTAGDVATQGPKTIGTEALAGEAVALMSRLKITSLFVVDNAHSEESSDTPRQPIGLIHIHDCLRAGVV